MLPRVLCCVAQRRLAGPGALCNGCAASRHEARRRRQRRDTEIAGIIFEVQQITGMSAGTITAEDQRQWRKANSRLIDMPR